MADHTILVIGTGNRDKIVEIRRILKEVGIEMDVRSVKEYDPGFDPVEDGDTLEENARIKAREAARVSDQWAIADDTGLFIDALNGEPGVYSSRYAGEDASYADNRAKVLSEMKDVPAGARTARFETVVALVRDGEEECVRGAVPGRITTEEIGENGFGYDAIFFSIELNKTFAEASLDEKNTVSHRGRAMRRMAGRLKDLLKKINTP